MAEIKSGIRNLLAHPFVYDSFQYMVGAYAWRRRVIRELVLPALTPNCKLLDIGCGTGEILSLLPEDIEYYGYDYNESYILQARKRFAHRNARFECKSVGSQSDEVQNQFDIALAFGLIHHLDDAEVAALVGSVSKILKPSGKVFLLDPVYCETQSSLSRFVVSTDRGRNVRTSDQYLELYRSSFPSVEIQLDHSPLRIPYTGITVTCSAA